MATKPTDKEYDRYKGLGAPYARPYSTKDFRWTSWIFFGNTFGPVSPSTKWTLSRSGVWRSTRFCLRACTTWRFLLGLRLLSRKWIADHILCHKQPRKPSDSWQCEQDKRVFKYLVFDFSKLIFSESNFKLPSIIQYLLIQNLINKQTG